MDEDVSKLTFYSIGVVLEDKELKSDYIIVIPMETLSLANGKLNEAENKNVVKMPDQSGKIESSDTTGNYKIQAKWIPFSDPNRLTAPDVIKNETVLIWKFGDTDDFYWCTIFREPRLRRLETVCWAFGNLPSFGAAWDKTTSYWMEFSTHEKTFQIHTADNDGEVTTYDIRIDARAGTLAVTDGLGNQFTIDSNENQVEMRTSAEAYAQIRGRNMTIECDDYVINCKTNTINASDSVTVTSPEISLNAGSSMSMSGPSSTIGGDNIQIQGGDIILTGGAITANGEDLTTDLT